ASSDVKHLNKRTSPYIEINDALYKWYQVACSKQVYPDGSQLMAKAKEIALSLEIPEFTASIGWFDRWKKRYNIKQMKICGESGAV
uniref:HTH CENPB-type domain-containing protein n=1 Tax=Amphimedon queenslandica TaxID=400682 RepID=A0A1X7SQ89_AMPQE